MRQIFEKMGVFLVDLMKLDRPGKGKEGIHQELIALSAEGKTAVRNYYVRKVSVLLMVLFAGLLFSFLGLAIYMAVPEREMAQLLNRPGYGEGDRKEALRVQVEGEENTRELEITVQERKYTDQEKQKLIDQALQNVEQVLPGENRSLDEVRSNLNFPSESENGAVKISWLTIPYGVIQEDGSLKEVTDEAGVLVEIQATLTCGGTEAVYKSYAKVFPPNLPPEERFNRVLKEEVERADAQSSHETSIRLPEYVEGKNLLWSYPAENPFPAMFILTLVMAVCIYLEMDSAVHRRAEARKTQLMLDYPDLMWKMTMLLGAGLSIRGTFFRISGEYQRKKKEDSGKKKRLHKTIRYVYEEVTSACYEMQSGVSEAQAYERFGKRCQLPEYIRLGCVLSQNVKKGAKGLAYLLETEAETSLNDRRNHARKIGEQAGTKLLVPMVLMLAVVLVILMVPAFLSF